MSHPKTIEELNTHKDEAISNLTKYLETLIASPDPRLRGKADKLSYWISDWVRFLEYEPCFSPKSLRRYKHGEIIKVHLGFNIGSEEGGLHYAVVVEKENAKSSPVVTVVPLTSVKPTTNISSLHEGNVFLGNELFTSLNSKITSTEKHLSSEAALLRELTRCLHQDYSEDKCKEYNDKLEKCSLELTSLERMRQEVMKMKQGSIALVNQITTISKIRIYDPKTDYDILSNIKLSNEKLDILDSEIRKRYTNFHA